MVVEHDGHEYELHVPYDRVMDYIEALPDVSEPEDGADAQTQRAFVLARRAANVASLRGLGNLVQRHVTARDGCQLLDTDRVFDVDVVNALVNAVLPELPFSAGTAGPTAEPRTAPAANSSSSAPPAGVAPSSEPPTPTECEPTSSS